MSRTKKHQDGVATIEDLRAEMARKRITRVQIAKELHLTHDYVCKILQGKRNSPKQRERIAVYLGLQGMVENPEFHQALGLKGVKISRRAK